MSPGIQSPPHHTHHYYSSCASYTHRYTSQLDAILIHELDNCRPQTLAVLPTAMNHTQTPAVTETWQRELVEHPDRQFVEYIVQGLTHGFRSSMSQSRLQQSVNKIPIKDPKVVSSYLADELPQPHRNHP